MRKALLALLVLATPAPSRALFHAAVIDEVMSGKGADPSVQFVEVKMLAAAQNSVAGSRLTFFDCGGTACTVLMQVPINVPNSGANVRWLMASPNDATFSAATGIHADFYWDNATFGNLDPSCGMICWGAPGIVVPNPGTWNPGDPNQYVDCVAYGSYTGPTKTSVHDGTPTSGMPTSLAPGNGTQSLTRSTSTGNNGADFLLAAPTPTNNGPGSPAMQATTATGACTPVATPTTTSTTTTTPHPGATTTTTTTTPAPAGTDSLLRGKRIVLGAGPKNAAKRSVVATSTDAAISIGAGVGSADDPTRHGGSLRLRCAAGTCDDTYPLASGWSTIGKGAGRGYRYRDARGANGPIRLVLLKPGRARLLKVMGKGAGLQTSLASNPVAIDLVLTTGDKRYCLRFDATARFKPNRSFTATGTAALSACPP